MIRLRKTRKTTETEKKEEDKLITGFSFKTRVSL
jgi:hypothetical protein